MILDPEYFEALDTWMATRHDWVVDPSTSQYSAGVVTALDVAVEKLTKEGDGVLINTPAYRPFQTHYLLMLVKQIILNVQTGLMSLMNLTQIIPSLAPYQTIISVIVLTAFFLLQFVVQDSLLKYRMY